MTLSFSFHSYDADKPSEKPLPAGLVLNTTTIAEQTQAMATEVVKFDRILNKRYLSRLSLQEIQHILADVQQFQDALHTFQQQLKLYLIHTHSSVEKQYSLRDAKTVIVAGCRLCADLSDTLHTRMIDQLQSHDETLTELHQAVREHVKNKYLTQSLMGQAIHLRHSTHQTACNEGMMVL